MAEESNVVGADFGSNEMTRERAAELTAEGIKDILEEQAKIDEIMRKAKEKCRPHADKIAAKKKQIREETNCPAKVLNTKVTYERAMQRHDKRVEALDEDEGKFFVQLEMKFEKLAA